MPTPGQLDKLLHLGAFAVLGGAATIGLRRALTLRPGAAAALGALCSAAFGALDEWHQSFVPGRDASLGDLLADALGAALAAAAIAALLTRERTAA